jgi:hypothetical protein
MLRGVVILPSMSQLVYHHHHEPELQADKPILPVECIMHPGRKVCNVDKLLLAS